MRHQYFLNYNSVTIFNCLKSHEYRQNANMADHSGGPGLLAKARLVRPRVCFDNASFEYESIEYLLVVVCSVLFRYGYELLRP